MNVSIHPIHMGLDTIYAVKGDGLILIDGGDPGRVGRFKKGMAAAGLASEDAQLILLTHGHWDHIGSVKDIQALTGAKVLLHEKDVHLVNNPVQPPGFTLWGKMITMAVKLYLPRMKIPAFDVDIVIGDNDVSLAEYGIPGTIIHTPGHSWGSVSVLLETGEAFVGDLAMNEFPIRLTPGLPIFGDDMEVVKDSWRKLLDRGVKTIYPAHGKPFSPDVIRSALAS